MSASRATASRSASITGRCGRPILREDRPSRASDGALPGPASRSRSRHDFPARFRVHRRPVRSSSPPFFVVARPSIEEGATVGRKGVIPRERHRQRKSRACGVWRFCSAIQLRRDTSRTGRNPPPSRTCTEPRRWATRRTRRTAARVPTARRCCRVGGGSDVFAERRPSLFEPPPASSSSAPDPDPSTVVRRFDRAPRLVDRPPAPSAETRRVGSHLSREPRRSRSISPSTAVTLTHRDRRTAARRVASVRAAAPPIDSPPAAPTRASAAPGGLPSPPPTRGPRRDICAAVLVARRTVGRGSGAARSAARSATRSPRALWLGADGEAHPGGLETTARAAG